MFFSKSKQPKTNEEPKWDITEQFLKDNIHDKQYPIADLLFAKQLEEGNFEVTVWYKAKYLCNLTIPESESHIFTRFSLKECADFIPSFKELTTEGLSGDEIRITNKTITIRGESFGLAGVRTQEINGGYEVLIYGKAIIEVSSEAAKQIELAKHVYLSRKYGLPNSELKKEYQNKLAAEKERVRLASVNQELVMLTTETNPDIKVIKRLDVITAECAYGMNIFKDFLTAFSDTFGGRSGSIQNTLRDARKVVLDELRKEALAIGANAVIAVDLDYSEMSGGGKSGMLFLVASGTAVVIDNG